MSISNLLPLAVAFCLALAASSITLAASFDKLTPQRFLYKGTFGLDLAESSPAGTHRVATYLPHTTIVFYHPNHPHTKEINGVMYRAVVTQFGQMLWVLDSEVSNKVNFESVFGTQNVIFNQDGFICPKGNKFCVEVSGHEIDRGSVLETVDAGDDFYHLRYKEVIGLGDQQVSRTHEGYLSNSQFDEFEHYGILTDARKQHPAALHIKTNKIDSLTTRCGEQWSGKKGRSISAEIGADAGMSILDFLSVKFGIRATRTDTETVQATFGGAGIATERLVLNVVRPDSNGQFSSQPNEPLYLSLEIECIGSQNDQEAVHISSVVVRDKDDYLGKIASEDFYNLPNQLHTPPEDALSQVYSKNGRRPFLLSISS